MTSIVIFWINLSYHWVGKFCQCCPVSTRSDFPPAVSPLSASVLCSERQRIITFSWPYRSRLVNGTKQQTPVTLLAVCNYTFEHSLSVSMHIACYSDKGSALHETKNYVAKTTQPLFSVDSCWFYQTIRFLVIPPSTNYTLTGHFIRYTYSTAW